MNRIFKILLFPFAIPYDLVTRFRNHLFNINYTKSFKFSTNVITVGNLSVGGTGKTPHVEYLIKLLKAQYKVAVLSRGYGRRTKGFHFANDKSTALQIGDEPMQYYKKFSGEISVAVGEERVIAIPVILHEKEDTNIILLDDAYQHRYVTPDLNILLTDYSKPFYSDVLLPAGRLRESRKGASRANAIIVTKCPSLMAENEKRKIIAEISIYNSNSPVFFSGIKYGTPLSGFTPSTISQDVILFSGLANPSNLEQYVKENFNLLDHLIFGDHHFYTTKDIEKIESAFNSIKSAHKSLLTTEKDLMRLMVPEIYALVKDLPIFYLPIEIYFLEDKQKFDDLIFKSIKSNFSDSFN